MLAAMAGLVGDRTLGLVIPAPEFGSMCNASVIASRFDVDVVHQRFDEPPVELFDFRPDVRKDGRNGLGSVRLELLSVDRPIPVDASGERALELLLPEIRLLPSYWAYDAATRTLFTGDVFSWVWYDTPAGPWIVEAETEDATSLERVREFLVRNRYWWLAGADTEPLRRSLAETFDRLAVDVVAPDHGAVLRGAAVHRHVRLLDDVLAILAREPSVGLEAARWPLR